MHPFGGTPVCPRCSKSVYAAEQVMGPGRKLYHKPCLACTICNKRLDSLTLLEHDQQPYCKSCHVKNFGTRDLRQANLPHREDTSLSSNSSTIPPPLPPSPIKNEFPPFANANTTPLNPRPIPSPIRMYGTGIESHNDNDGSGRAPSPSQPLRLQINRTLTPTSPTLPQHRDNNSSPETEAIETEEERDTVELPLPSQFPSSRPSPLSLSYTGTPMNSGRSGYNDIPRTTALTPTRTGTFADRPTHRVSNSLDSTRGVGQFGSTTLGRSNSSVIEGMRPLVQTSTGTRYGAALGGGISPARKWGGGGETPICPRCGKSVYFAEQVKAVGKTYHKACLRCRECSTLLDSNRLTEKDGEPLCHRCYGKLHGPQGSGYALLGKAGG